jgi:cytochrome c biogenesis protein CcdA
MNPTLSIIFRLKLILYLRDKVMTEWIIPITSAFWLGILTAISPCPLATNIAAISYVGKRVDKPVKVLSGGLLYTAGRILSYLLLGILLVSSILSAPMLAHNLQKYMNMILGPVLIIAGMILLELISIPVGKGGLSKYIQRKADSIGIWGAGLLGIVFALSFCPTSAALFFGSLIPLAIQQKSGILLPTVFGLATGLPVLLFAFLISSGFHKVASIYNQIVVFEKWARKITGFIFVLVGIYYSLIFIFHIPI